MEVFWGREGFRERGLSSWKSRGPWCHWTAVPSASCVRLLSLRVVFCGSLSGFFSFLLNLCHRKHLMNSATTWSEGGLIPPRRDAERTPSCQEKKKWNKTRSPIVPFHFIWTSWFSARLYLQPQTSRGLCDSQTWRAALCKVVCLNSVLRLTKIC